MADAELIGRLRQPVLDSAGEAVSRLGFGQSVLMRQQVSRMEDSPPRRRWLAALTCLGLADCLNVERRRSLPVAACLALLEAMAALLDELAALDGGGSPEPDSLTEEWGMARALNAADGLFALAHETALSVDGGNEAGEGSAGLIATLDACCTQLFEATRARWSAEGSATVPDEALRSAAVALAALLADLDAAATPWLQAVVFQDGAPASLAPPSASLTEPARRAVEELAAALRYWENE